MTEPRSERNAVFTEGTEGENPASIFNDIAQASSEATGGRLENQIEVGSAPLPSRGMFYPEEHPFHKQETAEIRGMTTHEEDLLMSRTLWKKGTVITELIRSCLMEKKININSLVVGDRDALAIAIRAFSYGSDYTTKVTCVGCEKMQETIFNLETLRIKEPDFSKLNMVAPNEFSFVVPTGRQIVFKYLTGEDEERMMANIEARKKRGLQTENFISTKLLSAVVSVDGKTDKNVIANYISKMPGKDSLALRVFMDENEPKIDTTVDFACPNCEREEKIILPVGINFFLPHMK